MSERRVVYTERGGTVSGLDEKLIRQNGGAIHYGKAVDERDGIRLAEHAESSVVSGTSLVGLFFAALPRLKGVVRLGIGVDSLDLDTATNLGIVVANIPNF